MNGRYIRHNEAILLTNHRKDRTQQVAEMLQHTNPLFTFATVSEHIDEKHVYHPVRPLHRNVCSELSRNGLSFTRISESCKFPHVTYFFNGYQDGTDHAICVPSLPESEYTRHPEMQLCELTERIVGEIASPHGNGIIANIPNLDQIGHLGQMPLAQQTAHAVDAAVRRIHATCQQHRWNLILTADHGNADQMRTPDGASFSSHSTNPVPLLYIPNHPSRHLRICQKGSIAQIAPTLLNILHRPIPHWMMPSLLQQRCLKATTRRHI